MNLKFHQIYLREMYELDKEQKRDHHLAESLVVGACKQRLQVILQGSDTFE